jgi:hypothetical protein
MTTVLELDPTEGEVILTVFEPSGPCIEDRHQKSAGYKYVSPPISSIPF